MSKRDGKAWAGLCDGVLGRVYRKLRDDCIELEMMLDAADNNGLLDKKTIDRLDKAVTVMKVGFKLIKKAANDAERGGGDRSVLPFPARPGKTK